ncbi:ATP-binding protein [Pyrobaculum neutrophilum]|uniref:4Fe-4S ferredoxin iron-sulfur binding domain protein n=1 Tax=Pyrobaculum neutrophilum (strain DSM 2338 / JCM 9278 / NBRC 100436 / V24Sta) TaxID=444157 RepID=B1YDX8_PYRNV|nr:4Fe-4S binding protein [Pyrobaculum neutrophilum]ACB39991.1 4Fe-4S ferredoxin iron-sulfur binding domain protein [Pyrobaculum neutrophilum V24Sta]
MKLTRRVAAIDGRRCAKCNLCVRTCPTGALKPPRVLYSRCTGCGLCTYTCPRGAIEMATRPSLAAYLLIGVLALAAVSAAGLILLTPYLYPSHAQTLNFTANVTLPTFTPTNATVPTGEEAAGAGSGFG